MISHSKASEHNGIQAASLDYRIYVLKKQIDVLSQKKAEKQLVLSLIMKNPTRLSISKEILCAQINEIKKTQSELIHELCIALDEKRSAQIQVAEDCAWAERNASLLSKMQKFITDTLGLNR